MATCKYCGKWCGVIGNEHLDCSILAAEGRSSTEIAQFVAVQTAQAAKPVTPISIFWAVFAALWAFGISAGIVASILRALLQ